MRSSKAAKETALREGPPPLKLGEGSQPDITSLGEVIEWFLDHDQRVAIIRGSHVEEIFQWKQAESIRAEENVFEFKHAEDRLVIGIMQALAINDSEQGLHDWISQLLNALEDAAKTNKQISAAQGLEITEEQSPVNVSMKITKREVREVFLNCCWLEALCTAEIRVLGWVYQELYGRPFAPGDNTRR